MQHTEIVMTGAQIYLAPVGESYPEIQAAPAGNWALLGTPAAEAITTAARRCDNRSVPLYCRPGR